LEFVDGTEVRDRAAGRIDARRPGAGQRAGELPGRKGIDGVVVALKDGAGGIEDGISERVWLREIYIERTNQVFSTNTEQRQGYGGVADNFFFQCEAGLLHARSHEVGGEGREIVRNPLCESGG
jgi:hypothetical protein